jgi:hypothetical protein
MSEEDREEHAEAAEFGTSALTRTPHKDTLTSSFNAQQFSETKAKKRKMLGLTTSTMFRHASETEPSYYNQIPLPGRWSANGAVIKPLTSSLPVSSIVSVENTSSPSSYQRINQKYWTQRLEQRQRLDPQQQQQGKRSHQEMIQPEGAASKFATVGFPDTLYLVLSSPNNQRIMSWLPNGKGFLIHDKALFVSQILPKYFGNGSFPSFTRKLKRWNFESVPMYPDLVMYRNRIFFRGSPALARRMMYVTADGEPLKVENGEQVDENQGTWGKTTEKSEEVTLSKAELATRLGLVYDNAVCATIHDYRQQKLQQQMSKKPPYLQQQYLTHVDPQEVSKIGHSPNESSCFTLDNKQQQCLNDANLQVFSTTGHSSAKALCFSFGNKQQLGLNNVDLKGVATTDSIDGMKHDSGENRNTMAVQGIMYKNSTASFTDTLLMNNRRAIADQEKLTEKLLVLRLTHKEMMMMASMDSRSRVSDTIHHYQQLQELNMSSPVSVRFRANRVFIWIRLESSLNILRLETSGRRNNLL